MEYQQFLDLLTLHAEEEFARFQSKLIPTSQTVLGVRTPTMRKIAKEYRGDLAKFFQYPDTVYEVTFIKLAIVATLPFDVFLQYVHACVEKIDNWSTCDTFKAKCIKNNQDAFLPILEELFASGEEFKQRYALVMLLTYYVEEKYLPLIEAYAFRADTSQYYVYMAVAWLVSEILVKHYDFGVKLLKKGRLDAKTHNKAIQKAIESYRLDKNKKDFLRTLRK